MAFPGTTIPRLPSGFFDRTYGNDVCSHFEKEWNGHIISVWIERDDPEYRDDREQYGITIKQKEETKILSCMEFSTDNFSSEALEKVSYRIRKEVYNLMKKYREV